MSGLAELLRHKEYTVTGSDISMGGHSTLPENVEIVVKNGAISDDNPELVQAKKLGLPIVDRSELLAQISQEYANIIAVAGTSGKSTTTAMIGEIFKAAGLNPTVHNGAVLMSEESGLHIGGDEYFITEACEFKKSFLTLYSTLAVITNIRPDHMNCYHDFDDLKATFKQFSQQSKSVIFGENFGNHILENIDLATRAAQHFEIDDVIIENALANFKGLKRRFEVLGKLGETIIVSDYAHHPDEIRTTIASANERWNNYLIVFQPHTYTRTRDLFLEFEDVLWNKDVILFKTYSAREDEIIGARAEDLADALNQPCFMSELRLVEFIKKTASRYEAVIFTGAGDIDDIARKLA